MTALAGYWSFLKNEDVAERCERMLRAQQVYAPDAPVSWRGDGFAAGRRLYKLLPEDPFDRGPVVAGGGRHVLVADVRLDNREELCEQLDIAPTEAATMADSAILMAALLRWDEAALDKLLGDFAFAWWDDEKRELLMARDFAGQRPLHYHRGAGFFAFASMPKGIHGPGDVPVRPNESAVLGFLALIPESGTETYYEGIEKVPPGHVVRVSADAISVRRYWNPARTTLAMPREEYEAALRHHLDRAVQARLRGCGKEVAAHLSGGLDSAAVAATAARLLAGAGTRVAAYTSVPVEGFTGKGLADSIADEGPLAEQVARLYPNIEHIKVRTGPQSPFDNLDRMFFLFERPFLNLCNGVWMQAICDRVKARRTAVLLTGQLGNLSISYDGMALLPQLLRQGRLIKLAALSLSLARTGTRLGTIGAQIFGPFLPTSLWTRIGRLRGKRNRVTEYTALREDRIGEMEGLAAARALDFSYRPRSDPHELRVWAILRSDPGNYSKGVLGGWGIDVRDPTADRRLVEFCLSVPAEEFVAGGVPRSLARRAFADRIPEAVLQERRKGYQAADWYMGLRAGQAQLTDEIARLADVPHAGGMLDLPRMRRLAEEMPEEGWESLGVHSEYRLALLRGTSAGHFLRKASGSNA
ncbi:MAG TPA: asparagine synthase-related protein [Allosphingosinicella sp.]